MIDLANPTVSTTGALPEVDVMTPAELEEACRQPVAIGTAVSMLLMLPVNVAAMFALFTKMNSIFNPNHISANQRRKQFTRRVMGQS
jgi:hypothetical protein